MSQPDPPTDASDQPAPSGGADASSQGATEPVTEKAPSAGAEPPPGTAPAADTEPPTKTAPAADTEPPTETGPTVEAPATAQTAVAQTAVGDSAPPAAAPATGTGTISRGRLIGVDALIVLTTILAIVGMLAVWANRLLFNPDNWASTSTQLLENPAVRSATANYVVDQLYANVNVAQLISSGLPPRLDPLAGPAAGALRNVAVQGVDFALQRPVVQSLWATANRTADRAFVAVVKGGKGPVGVQSGVVTLDLASIVDNAAARFGLPSSITSKLPSNIGTLTIIRSDQLSFIQKVGNAVRGLALWLSILVPLLYALAIFLARRHRRRTLMSVGTAIAIAGLAGFAGRHILQNAIVDSLVNNAAQRPAVRATVGIGTQILGEIAGAFIVVGLVVVIAAWFAGPAGLATSGRRALAPFFRERPGWAFAIVAAIMVLVFIWQPIPATGTAIGIIVFLALAMLGTEILRRQTAIEFPNAQSGETTAALRARVEHFRGARQHRHEAPEPSPPSLPDQLEKLAALRDSGSITPEDYEAAKANLLRG